MVETILKVTDLVGAYKGTFGAVYAVDGVSLEVQQGEIIGIAGESGSGKSTFLELITGVPRSLLYYESGQVNIKGYDIYKINKELLRTEVLSQIIGYVPQASMNSLNPVIKVKQFVLDVMKQRTSAQRGISRKLKVSNLIILKCLHDLTLTKITNDDIIRFLNNLVRYARIQQRPKISLNNLFVKMYEQKDTISTIPDITDEFRESLRILSEFKDFHLNNMSRTNKSMIQQMDPETFYMLLSIGFMNSFRLGFEYEIEAVLDEYITSKNYPLIRDALKPILQEAFLHVDSLEINPNWKDLYEMDITGSPIPPIPTRNEILNQAITHMKKIGLEEEILELYPHELSGGMKQRTVIAISTLWTPKLLIIDEPTSALDVTTQKKMLELIIQLKLKGIVESVLFISHDIPTLRQVCDRCVIMYAGKFVEIAKMDIIVNKPLHPYTQGLIGSIASFCADGRLEVELCCIPGKPPEMKNPPSGCRFHPRCPKRMDKCSIESPLDFYPDTQDHLVACWLYE